jgi:hypothetical protein
MSESANADGLRARLDAAGARPTEDELSRLLPVLERRLASWERLKGEPLDDAPPGFAFVPLE